MKKKTVPVAPTPQATADAPDALAPVPEASDGADRQNLADTQTVSQAELDDEPEAAEPEAEASEPEAPEPDASEPEPEAAEPEPEPEPVAEAPEPEAEAADPPPPEGEGPLVGGAQVAEDAPTEEVGGANPADELQTEETEVPDLPPADGRVMDDASRGALPEAFETPSGADWFLRTNNPAPARNDVVVDRGGDATPEPAASRAPAAAGMGLVIGLFAVAAVCFVLLIGFVLMML